MASPPPSAQPLFLGIDETMDLDKNTLSLSLSLPLSLSLLECWLCVRGRQSAG